MRNRRGALGFATAGQTPFADGATFTDLERVFVDAHQLH